MPLGVKPSDLEVSIEVIDVNVRMLLLLHDFYMKKIEKEFPFHDVILTRK